VSFEVGNNVRLYSVEFPELNMVDGVVKEVVDNDASGWSNPYLVHDHDGNYLGYFEYWDMTESPELTVELVRENAKVPTYGDGYAAGMDIYATESFTIPPRSKVNVPSGIKCVIPNGHYLIIQSRSGTAWKNAIEASNAGVIDQNYRKEIGVILYNNSDVPYHVVQGDRIAQMILQKFERANIIQGTVEDTTQRGGFGSTGK
jgi:dUTP pyrophosphatase